MTKTAAEQLAGHFAGLRLDAIPRKHADDVQSLVRDFLGVALGGSRTHSREIAARYATETGGVAEARLIGRPGKVPAASAAFVNAIASRPRFPTRTCGCASTRRRRSVCRWWWAPQCAR